MSTRLFGLVLATILLATLHSAQAQQAKKVPRIGLLFTGESSQPSPNVEAFRQGLRTLGYVEGKTIALEYRFAEGKLERLPQLAQELVGLPVEVIVTATSPAIHAAKRATDSIPSYSRSVGIRWQPGTWLVSPARAGTSRD